MTEMSIRIGRLTISSLRRSPDEAASEGASEGEQYIRWTNVLVHP